MADLTPGRFTHMFSFAEAAAAAVAAARAAQERADEHARHMSESHPHSLGASQRRRSGVRAS
jgi:hypothetical protein